MIRSDTEQKLKNRSDRHLLIMKLSSAQQASNEDEIKKIEKLLKRKKYARI